MVKKKKSVPTRTDVFDDFIDEGEKVSDKKLETFENKKVDVKVSSSDQQPTVDTSSWFRTEAKKPRRVAMTFTLDPKAIDLIEKAADKHKLSRSRIVEKIAFNTLND